ncbi:MAG TPA: hypothetical protein VFD38_03530, partial [Myxococcaceae bacterium]|nr:hypothetical protein [Myxococcaceae bacterium]
MPDTALSRFWRGVREPWELLGRMRHHRPLWERYWRTVLVQAALTLVVGLAVFWVGKQGAEAWNDAFGPDEVPQSSAPAAAGSGSTAPERPTPSPAAEGTATPARPTSSPAAEDTATPLPGAREPAGGSPRSPGPPPPERCSAGP